jgi:methyltransferase (TIGR00027 family)
MKMRIELSGLFAASKAKSTAQLTALGRATAFLDNEPLRAPDHLAIRFLDPGLAFLTRSSLFRKLLRRVYQRWFPGGYLYTIARTKHIDEVLQRELEAGTNQVVILGAGYDSRAYRFHDRFPATRFFELDYPTTSARKQAKVAALFDHPPDHVTYLAVDLTTQSLGAALVGAGYDSGRRTLFIWEGVTMYLPLAAVNETLAFVARQSGPGSSIVFDYIFRAILDGDTTLFGAAETIRSVRKRGEPFLFGIDAGGVRSFLNDRGLECLSDHGPSDLEKTYLTRSDGASFGRLYGYCAIAHARRGA